MLLAGKEIKDLSPDDTLGIMGNRLGEKVETDALLGINKIQSGKDRNFVSVADGDVSGPMSSKPINASQTIRFASSTASSKPIR